MNKMAHGKRRAQYKKKKHSARSSHHMTIQERRRQRNQRVFLSGIIFLGVLLILGIYHSHKKKETADVDSRIEETAEEESQDLADAKDSGTQGSASDSMDEAAIRESAAWKEIFDNAQDYPKDVLECLERNPEMLDFVSGYLAAGTKVTGGISQEESEEKCPLFIQWDERWGYMPYGDSNMGACGCGPTCLSMVAYSLTRNEHATPDAFARRAAQDGYYVENVGTSWSFLDDIAPEYGLSVYQCPFPELGELEEMLDEGNLFICSMGPGDFTDNGHFIVLWGVSESGDLLINDPFSKANSAKEWDYDTIVSQCKGMWAYSLA